MGTARFAPAAALLDGATREVAGTVCFAAPPPLWDSAGRRLTLVEALACAPQARPLRGMQVLRASFVLFCFVFLICLCRLLCKYI